MKTIDLETINKYNNNFIDKIQNFDFIKASIFNQMLLIGARFNDVYYLNNWEQIDDVFFRLKPLKNNNIRIINIKNMDPLLINQIQKKYNIYENTSYSNSLLWFKRIYENPFLFIKNKSVKTHIFRHAFAKNLKKKGKTDNEIKIILGERNQSSANQYIYSDIYTTI